MYKKSAEELAEFRLPRYKEITDVGLYLEQTVRLINTALSPLGETELTASMVSNYVKKKLVANPRKKLYYAEHIAELLIIAVVKNAVALEDIRLYLERQREWGDAETAYNAFCGDFERLLQGAESGETESDGFLELREIMLTAAVQRIRLDRYPALWRQEK